MTSLLQNSIQTTAYSLINLHDLELNDLQTTQASYPDPRNNQMAATSFDSLFVQTTQDSTNPQVCTRKNFRVAFNPILKIIGLNDVSEN